MCSCELIIQSKYSFFYLKKNTWLVSQIELLLLLFFTKNADKKVQFLCYQSISSIKKKRGNPVAE